MKLEFTEKFRRNFKTSPPDVQTFLVSIAGNSTAKVAKKLKCQIDFLSCRFGVLIMLGGSNFRLISSAASSRLSTVPVS